MPSARSLAFAAAMRMVDRVHRYAAIHRTPSQPTSSSSLADRDVLVIDIAHLPDSGHAILRNLAGFSGRQFHQSVVAFFRDQLGGTAGGTHHLRALARLQLDIVDGGAGRDVAQGQRVPYQDVGFRTADNFLSDL